MTSYPETLEEFIANYRTPFQVQKISYSYNEDDTWGTRRNTTCIAAPVSAAEIAIRSIADRYYADWRTISMRYTERRDAVLIILREGGDLTAAIESRTAADVEMEQLVETIRAESAECKSILGVQDAVQHRLAHNPPVCNIGCLGTDAAKGYLDVLWHALIR